MQYYAYNLAFNALLRVRKSIRPAKNWAIRCWHGYLCGSKVQMICVWSNWCHCHPINSCFIKIQNGLTFLLPAYPGCLGKEAVKQVSVYYA